MTSEFRSADAAFFACKPAEASCLPELPPSRWRSLGKHLDYTYWADRDRFVELDARIMANKELELQRTDNSRSAEAKTEQSDRTDENAHAHLIPDDLEVVLKQLTPAVCDLRPAA